MIILISSDRGLAGAYNSNILRVANRFAARQGKHVQYVTIGKKGRDSVARARQNLVAEFISLPAEPTIADISPIARLAIDEFLTGHVDEVFIAYTDFVNLLTQHPVVQRLLPLVPYETNDTAIADIVKGAPQVTGGSTVYEFEPDPVAILEEIVPRFTVLQLFQAVLESRASEESSRMVAMRNASDNAASLITDYTLAYNKARQAAITSEILDIVGGAEALQSTIDKASEIVEHELIAL
jgi:F-type H+-transporting ATPase subunit gamma